MKTSSHIKRILESGEKEFSGGRS